MKVIRLHDLSRWHSVREGSKMSACGKRVDVVRDEDVKELSEVQGSLCQHIACKNEREGR